MSEMLSRPEGSPPEPSEGYDKRAAETPIPSEKEKETLAWTVTGLRDSWLNSEKHAKEQSHILDMTDKLKPDQPFSAIQEKVLGGLKIDPTNYILALSQARDAVTTLNEKGETKGEAQLVKIINYQDQNGSAGQSGGLDRQIILLMTPEQLTLELKSLENVTNLNLPHDPKILNEKILQAATTIQKEMVGARASDPNRKTIVDDHRVQELTDEKLAEPDDVKQFADARLSKLEKTQRVKPEKKKPNASPAHIKSEEIHTIAEKLITEIEIGKGQSLYLRKGGVGAAEKLSSDPKDQTVDLNGLTKSGSWAYVRLSPEGLLYTRVEGLEGKFTYKMAGRDNAQPKEFWVPHQNLERSFTTFNETGEPESMTIELGDYDGKDLKVQYRVTVEKYSLDDEQNFESIKLKIVEA